MNFAKYLTAFSVFSVALGLTVPASAISFEGTGLVNTKTTVEGKGSVTNNVDLDPNNQIDDFSLDQLLLQGETFQGDSSFQNQFGANGQVFAYDELKVNSSVLSPSGTAGTLIDYAGGPPGTNPPSFTFNGISFELNSQPDSRKTAEHKVVRTANGSIEIRLKEGQNSSTGPSAKVTYAADLPDTTQDVSLDYTYGNNLSGPTPKFSNLQAFFRRDPAKRNPNTPAGAVKSQFLVGSDETNPDSAFAGNIARQFNQNQETAKFVTNAGYPTSGNFQLNQEPVPFEVEGTMGLVALGGYLWYRNRKKRKQTLSQESNN